MRLKEISIQVFILFLTISIYSCSEKHVDECSGQLLGMKTFLFEETRILIDRLEYCRITYSLEDSLEEKILHVKKLFLNVDPSMIDHAPGVSYQSLNENLINWMKVELMKELDAKSNRENRYLEMIQDLSPSHCTEFEEIVYLSNLRMSSYILLRKSCSKELTRELLSPPFIQLMENKGSE